MQITALDNLAKLGEDCLCRRRQEYAKILYHLQQFLVLDDEAFKALNPKFIPNTEYNTIWPKKLGIIRLTAFNQTLDISVYTVEETSYSFVTTALPELNLAELAIWVAYAKRNS